MQNTLKTWHDKQKKQIHITNMEILICVFIYFMKDNTKEDIIFDYITPYLVELPKISITVINTGFEHTLNHKYSTSVTYPVPSVLQVSGPSNQMKTFHRFTLQTRDLKPTSNHPDTT